MKLKIKQSVLRNGERLDVGDSINLPDETAKVWIKKGFAVKEVKAKIETKEFKAELKETKDEADKD